MFDFLGMDSHYLKIVSLYIFVYPQHAKWSSSKSQVMADTGRALILKNYYIMCIIPQIVVPIIQEVLSRFTKFGQHKHKFFTVISNSVLYKKMFTRHE